MTSIGNGAFYACGLTSVTCNRKTPPSISSNTFSSYTATLYVPYGCEAVYRAAAYWSSFGTIIEDAGSIISFADDAVKAICISNWDTNSDGDLREAEAAAVTDLGEVFKENATITSFDELQYFTGLSTIAICAFYNCTSLTSVSIPENVTSIGSYAFEGCSGLTSVIIPESVTSIGHYAFYDCGGSLTVNCNIPNTNLNTPTDSPFYGSSFDTVIFGNNVTSIGDNGFYGCFDLSSITIPNSVTFIGMGAFSCCWGLNSIQVESGNSKYDSRNDCNAVIETSTNTLIAGCKNTVIPSTVTSIDHRAFYGCSGLTSISIPNSVTDIKNYAFYSCTDLISITIPNSVTTIGAASFRSCSGLISVSLPNNLRGFGEQAFGNCRNLTSVVSKDPEPWYYITNHFQDVASTCTLTVPYGTRDAYIAAGWTTSVFKGGVVEETEAEVTVGSSGLATFCSYAPLDFTGVSGLKAYIASGFEPSTGTLVLTRALKVPAGEGLYLVGDAGTYEVPISETDMIYSNLLKGVTTATTISPTDGSYTNFILANGSHGVGFYTLSAAGELSAGKAYLQIPTASLSSGVKAISVIFDDDETAIQNIKEETNVQGIYNLQGQQVNAPKSGLYIINGKKVVIK